MRPIAISLSPNAERQDFWRALFLLWRPWRWKGNGKSPRSRIRQLEREFASHMGAEHVWSFNSGRSALFVLLRALDIKADDEIIVQAFTCNAVPNPILWLGAKPVYADIERLTYNIDPADFAKKITPRTKAVIVQHTFGIPANIEAIRTIAQKRKLFLIEDGAHALGAKAGSRKVGTFGDAAFFSFGRDKVISSVYGGMLTVKDAALAKKIDELYGEVPFPSRFWVLQQLLHPIVFGFALPVYRLGIGKLIVAIARKLHVFSMAVSREERIGKQPAFFPRRLPEGLARLALSQFRRLERFNEYRRGIAHYYESELKESGFVLPKTENTTPAWLRYPVQHKEAEAMLKAARKKGMQLGDWYREIIAPTGTDLEAMHYKEGSCPVAEEVAKKVINLPTYPRLKFRQAEKVVKLLSSLNQKAEKT